MNTNNLVEKAMPHDHSDQRQRIADTERGWRMAYPYLVPDGTAEDSEWMERLEAEADIDRDDAPEREPVPVN